jgi:hypothetical protein
MLSTTIAFPLALLPLLSLIATLAWMARGS